MALPILRRNGWKESAESVLVVGLGIAGFLFALNTGPENTVTVFLGIGAFMIALVYTLTLNRRVLPFLRPRIHRIPRIALFSALFVVLAPIVVDPWAAHVPVPVKTVLFFLSLGIGVHLLWPVRSLEHDSAALRESWWLRHRYSIGIVVLTVLAIPLLMFRLGDANIHGDETQVVAAAAGYHHTGEYYLWDFMNNDTGCRDEARECRYIRAWPHTWLIAKSYGLFGISEWSSRMPSVVFGILFVPLVFLVTRRMFGRWDVAVMVTLATLFNPVFIGMFRYTRMYALLIPLFLALWYVVFQALSRRSRLGYSPAWVVTALILLLLLYKIHLLSLIILPVAFVFVAYLVWAHRERRHFVLLIAGLCAIAVSATAVAAGLFPWFRDLTTFFGRSNYEYLPLFASGPFPPALILFLVALGSILVFRVHGTERSRLVYLYASFLVPLTFFIWFADRYSGQAYVSHLVIFPTMLGVATLAALIRRLEFRPARILLYGTFVAVIALGFIQRFDEQYDPRMFSSFAEAYRVIAERIDPIHNVLFGLYLKDYYLSELSGRGLRVIDMPNGREYTMDAFARDIATTESGWITWETKKGYHLREEIRTFIDDNFLKFHGEGVDDTGVEVYYFTRRTE